jgi:F-box domain
MSHCATPSLLEPPTSHHALSVIEQLPFEIIVNIASYCHLPSALSLSSTSRRLRSKYLGSSSDRDYFACLWIKTSAPWYEVHLPEDHVCQKAEVACNCQKMGWGYLVRCLGSGSMMNRKRIWDIGQQLESDANKIGV